MPKTLVPMFKRQLLPLSSGQKTETANCSETLISIKLHGNTSQIKASSNNNVHSQVAVLLCDK